jgi:general secretion pathway protein C
VTRTIAALTVLAAAGALAATALLRHAGPPIARSERPPLAAPPPSDTVWPADRYVEGILARNLFDPAAIGVGPGAVPPGVNGLRLVAVQVADPEEYSAALILAEPDLPRSYSLGQVVGDRVLASVAFDRIELRRPDGRIEVLRLDAVAEVAPEAAAVLTRAELDEALLSPQALGQASAQRAPDGAPGYRLTRLQRGSLPDRLGLQNGDVVLAVNGRALDSPAAALEAVAAARTSDRVCLTIARRGETLSPCYDVR